MKKINASTAVAGLILAVLLLAAVLVLILTAGKAAAVDLSNQQREPSIELSCEKLGGVVFYDTGELSGAAIDSDYVSLIGDTLYFTHDVRLKGQIIGDHILFDKSTISTPVGSFSCESV